MPRIADDRFSRCYAETLKWEGGYSNDPHDPGGATMNGVTQRVYDGYRDSHGLPRRDVRLMEPHERLAIYRQNYWMHVRGDDLPPGIDLAVFDFGVNSGPTRAAKYLQRLLGVNQDGHIGTATIGAAKRADPERLVRSLMAERRRFIRQISTYWRFGKGWERRCNGVEQAALAMCGRGVWQTEVVSAPPLPDPRAQAATQGRATADDPVPPQSAEVALGTSGTGGIAYEVSGAFGRMYEFSPKAFAIALLSSPAFWISVIAVVSAAYVFLWRKAHTQ